MEQGTQYTLSGKTNGVFSNVHDVSVESDRCVIWLINNETGYYIIISDPNTGNKGTVFTWDYPSLVYILRVNVYHPSSSNQIKAWNLKIEKGNKATDWTPAPEDVDSAISTAQNSANTANNLLADIANDNIITPSEKQNTKKEWDIIVGEKSVVESQANSLGVSTTSYVNA